MHFLHTESRAGLELVDQLGNRKKHITAEVVEKEYCQVTFTDQTCPASSDLTLDVGQES